MLTASNASLASSVGLFKTSCKGVVYNAECFLLKPCCMEYIDCDV